MGALWFDTPLRGTPGRLTTNGGGRLERKRPVGNRCLRPEEASEQKTAGDAGMAEGDEDGRVGDLRLRRDLGVT